MMFFVFATTHTASASYKTLESVPGIGQDAGFTGYVTGIYNFAIGFVLIAALLMITIGGFYYITSAGNQAQAGSAKKIITDALLGLVVVFLIYLILNTINPDLMNSASPNLGALQQGVQGGSQSDAPGKAVQRTSYCSGGTCYNNEQSCIDAGGTNCTKADNSFEDRGIYTLNNGKYTKYNGTYAECVNSGAVCDTGQNIKNDLKYGAEEAKNRARLRSGGKIRIAFNAKTTTLSDKGVDTLRKVPDALGKDSIYIEGVSDDGKVIYTNVDEHIAKLREIDGEDNEAIGTRGYSWGRDANGNRYYQIIDENSPLYGTVFVDEDGEGQHDRIILPKEDGGLYSLDDLNVEDNGPDAD